MGAAKACSSPYESARNQRVEENKRRLQELGLTELSRDLSNNAAAPSRPSPAGPTQGRPRVTKEKVTVQLRRSTRIAGGEQPDYVEVEVDIRRRARFDNTGGTRHYSRLYERKYASEEARMSATEKAEALKKMLPQRHASFVKPMLQSHVTGGFWLGLPVAFCRDYLPKRDDRIVLEDDKNEEWETIYLSNKTGLSGGWRGFSLDHGLVDGDAIVFELVEPKRFKVHIIRVYGTNGVGAELESDVKEQRAEAAEKASSSKVRQKLIWATEPEKGEDMAYAKTRSDDSITGDESASKRKERIEDDYVGEDVKPNMHDENSRGGAVKEEMECGDDDAWNEDVHLSKRLKVEAKHCSRSSRVKVEMERGVDGAVEDVKNGGNCLVKEERETGNDDGFEDVKNAHLFDTTSDGKKCRDMTSYMRSKKKHMDVTHVNVKKEMQSSLIRLTV